MSSVGLCTAMESAIGVRDTASTQRNAPRIRRSTFSIIMAAHRPSIGTELLPPVRRARPRDPLARNAQRTKYLRDTSGLKRPRYAECLPGSDSWELAGPFRRPPIPPRLTGWKIPTPDLFPAIA